MNEATMHTIMMMLELQGQLMTESLKTDEMRGLMHEMEDGSRIILRVRWAPPREAHDNEAIEETN